MGIREILGRGTKRDDHQSEDGYYRHIIGTCTKKASEVLRGNIDVSLPGKFKSKARFYQCVECGLIDCSLRDNERQAFRAPSKCPRCGGRYERKFN